VAWLMVVMAVVTLTIVVLRYGLDAPSIALQEAVVYLHATAFMLGIAYTLKHDEHVRVDIFYARRSVRGRAWTDLAGHLLLLIPVAATLCWLSLPYVRASWRILEGSSEVGGIPGIFLLKTLIPLMALLLLAQGLARILRAVQTIRSIGRGAPVE
jgi:TRAP-type mannitol/chloroaromatic compound transport system permease small subunit